MSRSVDWTKVSVRYAVIGLAGSLAVVAGTYVLELFQISVNLERDAMRDAIIAHVSHAVESADETLRERRSPVQDTPRPERPVSPRMTDTPDTPDPAKPERKPDAPRRYWGVVQTPQTPVYNRAGKHLRSIEAGTLVDVLAIRDTNEGQLAICTLHYQGRKVPDVLVMTRDLSLVRGTLEDASERERALRTRHASLAEQIADREHELRRRETSANPHAARFEKARSDYLDFARRAEELTKKRDAAASGDRMKYADQLRMMLGEGAALRNEYEAARREYENWKAARGGQPSTPHDDTLARLRAERARLENELRALARP